MQAVRYSIKEAVEENWIEFGQVMSILQNHYPYMISLLDDALDYFIRIEDYELCILIYHCNRFIKGRMAECDKYLNA